MRPFTTPKSPEKAGDCSSSSEDEEHYQQRQRHLRQQLRQQRQQQRQAQAQQRMPLPSPPPFAAVNNNNNIDNNLNENNLNNNINHNLTSMMTTPSKLIGKLVGQTTPNTAATEAITPTTFSEEDSNALNTSLNTSSEISDQGAVVTLFRDNNDNVDGDNEDYDDANCFGDDDVSPVKPPRHQQQQQRSSPRTLPPIPLPSKSRLNSSHRISVSASSLPLSPPQQHHGIATSVSPSPTYVSNTKIKHARSFSGDVVDSGCPISPSAATFGLPERRRSSASSKSSSLRSSNGSLSSSYRKSASLGLPKTSYQGRSDGGKFSDFTPDTEGPSSESSSTPDTSPSPDQHGRISRGRSATLSRSRSGQYTNSVSSSLTSSSSSNTGPGRCTSPIEVEKEKKSGRRIYNMFFVRCNTKNLILIFCFSLGLLSFGMNYVIHLSTGTLVTDDHHSHHNHHHKSSSSRSKSKHKNKHSNTLGGLRGVGSKVSTTHHKDATSSSSSSSSSSKTTTKSTSKKTSSKTTTSIGSSSATSASNRLIISKPKKPIIVDKSNSPVKISFDEYDINMFSTKNKSKNDKNRSGDAPPRVVVLDSSSTPSSKKQQQKNLHRDVTLYPADFTDNTQLYGLLDSNDVALEKMEIRAPYSNDECVPMQDWQTTFHPSCNMMHELALEHMGRPEEQKANDVKLFGTGGFWRYAWRLDLLSPGRQFISSKSSNNSSSKKKKSTTTTATSNQPPPRDTVVLKTLKYEHNFEDAHFEHDRIDAVAMERLTSSEHVINVFGFCGHSVMTEYADGKRVGELADKSKKKPLARLKIASDIAHGLADVHGIDGDGNATFVHLDINPANVVSIGGTLKLNDFNIGIILRWNTTSNANKQCGFSNSQYPNPQWRSPEEQRDEYNLTEKVDIFSMGHIFFRLICGHEPWNKFEVTRPTKEEINEKVKRGVLPTIPDSIMNTKDKEEIAIRDVMLQCYKFHPNERPSAREIANKLDKALEQLSTSTTTTKRKTKTKLKKTT